jgi:hypothetical protein
MNDLSVRLSILKGLAVAPVPFSEQVIADLERRVAEKCPDEPHAYAFVVARNWAIDSSRKAARQARLQVESALCSERERLDRERFEAAREEFYTLVGTLAFEIPETQIKYLGIVGLTVFEGCTDPECARHFPGTRDARYQWKRRGMKLVWPRASANLRAVLFSRRMRTEPS